MRWLVAISVVVVLSLLVCLQALKTYPYKKYSQWMSGEGQDKYFTISPFKELYLAPIEAKAIPSYQEDYVQLWKSFPLRESMVPLPTRHPLFQTVPIIEINEKQNIPQIGMSILAANGRELFRIYIPPTSLYPDHTNGQELFKLPFIKNRILQKSLDTIWKDVFSLNLEVKKKSIDEMIYDLYILHLRSKLLPEETVRYGLMMEGKLAVVELVSANKDYMVELVMSLVNGTIYSYIMRTEINNADSQKLRSKFMKEVNPSSVDESMSRILYLEFKQLHFARQIDQEGMIYLFSAWSQNTDSPDMLREMIFYLERGKRFPNQLKVLYQYAFKKYGKTFTTSSAFSENEGEDLQLQRKIELEHIEKLRKAGRLKGNIQQTELTPDEKMNLYLKKAKETKPADPEDITVH